jgi:toxin ParE1/3/4
MAQAVRRPAARRDFINHYVYLAENASLETAKRFRNAVEATYLDLAKMPHMGSPGKIRAGKHAGVRLWRVRDFENYLIAYRPHRGGIAIDGFSTPSRTISACSSDRW